ncbi:MAG TPA: hypothetical protein DDY77_03885 [Clostridiales bacterium]|nr:hypothetical protein [Clostridiales bacterium]
MAEKTRKKHILIVGNPNAGKTTLYNALTGRNERVGNWHGVTVESSSAESTINGVKFIFTDVPGIYSLKEYAAEEANAAKTIFNGNFDAIIVVTEADKLKRGLKLVGELRFVHAPILLFINLYGDFFRRGGKFDEKELEKSVGAKVIYGEAVNHKDVEKVREFLTANLSVLPADNRDFGYVQAKPKLSKLEKLLVGKFTALPIFAAIMLFCFWLSFGEFSPVSLISGAIGRLFNDFIGNRIYLALYKKNLFLARLISEGIVGGLSSVAEFIPQIMTVSFCLDFLDQSGYISRLSAYADGFLRKFSLGGRSVYTLSSGFGCTAVSAITAKGIDDERVKLRAVLSLPFVSCSAKTPVYFYIAQIAFRKYAFLVIFGVYILSLILPLIHSLILSKTAAKGSPEPLIEEIADFKIPKLSTLSKSLLKNFKEFIIKLSTVVFTVSLAVWLAMSVSPDLRLLASNESSKSILAAFGRMLAPVFKPLGLDWRIAAALFSGIFAKESIVSSLALLYPEGLSISIAQGLALTAFCYFYTPCITALSAFSKTIGKKYALLAAIYQLLLAIAAMYAVFYLSAAFGG